MQPCTATAPPQLPSPLDQWAAVHEARRSHKPHTAKQSEMRTCSAEKSRRRRRSSMLGRIPRALAAAALRLNVYPFSLQTE